jgi:hypothetical protein
MSMTGSDSTSNGTAVRFESQEASRANTSVTAKASFVSDSTEMVSFPKHK